jgi:glucose-6-phosphate 1-dehydrogenase
MSSEKYSFKGSLCIEVSPIPNFVVIFGASGDLAKRKLLPALFSLYRRNLFHERSRIIGAGRAEMSDESFRAYVREALGKGADQGKLSEFIEKIHYVSGDYSGPRLYSSLKDKIKDLECRDCTATGGVFYLATPPDLYSGIASLLAQNGLTEENYEGLPWRHVVFEKPFGRDLAEAEKLDRELHSSLKERQIYRIDHYLGKETVQNILMLRFANRIFEPVWDNHFIESVQITAAETLGVEHRAGYYERTGLLRDMFQNHMLEMLALVTMEAPSSFDADRVRDEKAKLLRSIRPFSEKDIGERVIRAQYTEGGINGVKVPGYRAEKGVAPDSMTETFAAAKINIDNWRWQGVNFFLRSGKRMPRKLSEIAITFKKVPHSIFTPVRAEDLSPNTLVITVQPEEGLSLTIQAKQPGPKLCMGSLTMDFKYADILEGEFPDAYERLLLDCMLGDQTLFIRSDTIKLAWELLTPVLNHWECENAAGAAAKCPLLTYPAGSWGPSAADALIEKDGCRWRNF